MGKLDIVLRKQAFFEANWLIFGKKQGKIGSLVLLLS
jgi:hypothetical protein